MSIFDEVMNNVKQKTKEDAFASVQGYWLCKTVTDDNFIVNIDNMHPDVQDKTVTYGLGLYRLDDELCAANKPCWGLVRYEPMVFGIGGRDYEAIVNGKDAADTIVGEALHAWCKGCGIKLARASKFTPEDEEKFKSLIIKCDDEDEEDDEFYDDEDDDL